MCLKIKERSLKFDIKRKRLSRLCTMGLKLLCYFITLNRKKTSDSFSFHKIVLRIIFFWGVRVGHKTNACQISVLGDCNAFIVVLSCSNLQLKNHVCKRNFVVM